MLDRYSRRKSRSGDPVLFRRAWPGSRPNVGRRICVWAAAARRTECVRLSLRRGRQRSVANRPSQTWPLIYPSVDCRLDAAVKAARANGGKVLEERQQIGPNGYRAIIVDSEGNRLALHSSAA